ncbi:MAG: response regulator transcription factor [Vampirovibrionales bacterium]|nr:response regulator transcription factor [Vampirovibrionales bacterium]
MKILLVEDEPLWQTGIAGLLALCDDCELAGVADNFDDALTLYDDIRPDVALLDWKLRGSRDGLQVADALLEKGHPERGIILISGSDPALMPQTPFRFVPKSRISSDLRAALKNVTNYEPAQARQ